MSDHIFKYVYNKISKTNSVSFKNLVRFTLLKSSIMDKAGRSSSARKKKKKNKTKTTTTMFPSIYLSKSLSNPNGIAQPPSQFIKNPSTPISHNNLHHHLQLYY